MRKKCTEPIKLDLIFKLLIGWLVSGIQPDSCQSILLLFVYYYNNKCIYQLLVSTLQMIRI